MELHELFPFTCMYSVLHVICEPEQGSHDYIKEKV